VELEAAVHRGKWVDLTDTTTVTEACRRWAASRPHRPTTAVRVQRMIRQQVEPSPLGSMRLVSVKPSDVQGWVTGLVNAGLAPATVKLYLRLFSAVCNSAVLDSVIPSSPVQRITLPRPEVERVVPLTVAQVRIIADAVPPRNRAMVITQAGLGLRVGELLALRVADVDFLRRTTRVEHQLERGTRQRVAPKTPAHDGRSRCLPWSPPRSPSTSGSGRHLPTEACSTG
jgi:integrase